MTDRNAWAVAIRQAAPTASGGPAPVDLTARVEHGGFGYVNRAAERELLNLKTGDLTLRFRNRDGFLDSFFSALAPDGRWTMTVSRRGLLLFTGVVMGQGSIRFDRRSNTCELTAYGPSRVLADADAAAAARGFSVNYLTAGVTAGVLLLTLQNTTNYLPGDTLHLRSEDASEDVVVKKVNSSTQVTLETATVYAHGGTSSPTTNPTTLVTNLTPFYRAKTVPFLVAALAAAAGVGVAEVLIDNSAFALPVPVKVNSNGLSLTTYQGASATQRSGRCYVTLDNDGVYYQTDPSADWVKEDALDRPWIDWSHQFRQDNSFGGNGEPVILARSPDGILLSSFGNDWMSAYDLKGGLGATPLTGYILDVATSKIQKKTSNDGTTWSGTTDVATLPTVGTKNNPGSKGVEYDPVRNALYVWYQYDNGNLFAYYYDVGGGTFTNLDAGDGYNYFGFVYVPELDATLALRSTVEVGPTFDLIAFRGTTRLWVRLFPRCYIASQAGEDYNYPSRTLRWVDGSICGVVISDGAVQFVRSSDQFQSYKMNKLVPGTNNVRVFGGRVNGQYRISSYDDSSPPAGRNWMVADQQFVGVIEYADFTDQSVAEGLKRLAILTNCLFYLDDTLALHFVARDLVPSRPVIDVADRVKDRNDLGLWDQVVQYVQVSGDGAEATAGQKRFASSGLSISSPLITNDAYAQAVADSFYSFFSRQRKLVECILRDPDGHVYYPLDRVTLGATRYLVYESNHAPTDDAVTLRLLEDV